MPANKPAGIKPYLAGIASSTIFGFSFLFTKDILDELDVWRLLGIRFFLAALVLAVLIRLGLVKSELGFYSGRKGKDWRPLLGVALLQPVAYFIFETFGLSLTTSSQAGTLIALIPVFVIILGYFLLNERPSNRQISFILLSVGGVIFLTWQQRGLEAGGSWLGALLVAGAAASAAAFNIASRRASTNYSPAETTVVMMSLGAVIFNIAAIFVHWQKGTLATFLTPLLEPRVLLALAYLGIGSSVLAFFLVNYSLNHLPVSQSAVFSNLITIITVGAGVVFRREPFSWLHALGVATTLIGVWGANYYTESKLLRQIKQTAPK